MPEKERMIDDVAALAGVENRGPATEGEARAADYIRERMEALGLNPEIEPFLSSPHFSLCWALHFLLCSVSCLLAFHHPVMAMALILFVLLSFYGDSTTRFYLLRRLLPRRESRHVVGGLEPAGKRRKTVVVAAHMDAGQMGRIFDPLRSEKVAAWFKNTLGCQPLMLSLVVGAMVLALAGAALHALHPASPWSRVLLIAGALANLVPMGVFIDLEWAKISPGANDNASGVAVMLELARRIASRPLKNTSLIFVGVGSEETYMYGMARFMDERRALLDKGNTYFLVPESLGSGTPHVVVGEGVAWVDRHDPALCGAVFVAARNLGFPQVEPVLLRTGGTDATPPTVRGYAAMCLIALNENGYPDNYHWHTDTVDRVDKKTMKMGADILHETIRIIDKSF